MPSRRRKDGFNPFSLGELLSRPFRSIGRKASGLRGSDHSIGQNQSVFGGPLSLLTLPFRLLWGLATFMVQSWAITRHLKPFLLGVPAILAVGGLATGLWAANFWKEKISVNRSLGHFAMHSKQSAEPEPESTVEDAMLFARKLVDLKPDEPGYKYQLGLTHQGLGDLTNALDIMNYLTADEPGHIDAHIWLANHYLTSPTLSVNPSEIEPKIRTHLTKAIQQNPDNQRALLTEAYFYQSKASRSEKDSEEFRKNLQAASKSLEKIIDGRVTILQLQCVPMLVQIQQELGENEKAKRYVDTTMTNIMPLARKNADISQIWKTLVHCALRLEDYEMANKIIFQGLQIAQAERARSDLKQMTSMVLLHQINQLKDHDDPDQYRQRLKLLSKAVASYLRDLTVYQMLAEAIVRHADPKFDDDWIRQALIASDGDDYNPAVIHIILGIDEIIEGNVLEGQQHWRVAHSQLKTTPVVIQNLGDVILSSRPESIENMVDVLTLAIETFPENPMLLFTRATYYRKKDQFQNAIDDLNHAAEKLPDQLNIKKLLAVCYRLTGQEKLAIEKEAEINLALSQLTPAQRALFEKSLGFIQ